MPISKEQQARYPANWADIRARILDRANNRCEWCGVENHAIGTRDKEGKFTSMSVSEADVAYYVDEEKTVRIVLTIAHVNDPDPANCADDNLAALCQRCHNRHDAPMRQKNAAATIARKRDERTGQETLPGFF